MSLIARFLGGGAEIVPQRSERTVRLGTDEVHVYNAVWGIPESIGGMTTAALRRIRSFQTFGRPLSQTLLTLSPHMDVDETRTRLLSEGRINEDVSLINIWEDLRGKSDAELSELRGMTPKEPVPPTDGEVENITGFFDVVRARSGGKTTRRHYYRADGGLLLADVVDPKIGRRFVLHTQDGKPLREWRSPRDFYNAWISSVISQDPAVLIVDDKKISEFVHEITERTFGLVLFMHGSHLRHPWNGPHGQMLPRRVETMRNFDRFDAVGVQTQQQADAIAAIGFPASNIRFLTGELPSAAVSSELRTDRPKNNAVMVANLIALKRVDHAIRAIAELKGRGVDVHLSVLGEGAMRPALERLIAELDLSQLVELPGYVNDVPERLQAASFSMLTSTSEGLPLAMMESMGSGCVPIVYDITYGPEDLVEHGHNGFITPRDDIAALADQIQEFIGLGAEQIDSMRAAAKKTVERYLPEVGYQRWRTVLEELELASLPQADPRETGQAIVANSISVEPVSRGAQIRLGFRQINEATAASLQLVASGRELNTFFVLTDPRVERLPFGQGAAVTFSVDDVKFSESTGETFDIFLRRPRDPWAAKRRISVSKGFDPTTVRARQWYATKHGNLSVRPKR